MNRRYLATIAVLVTVAAIVGVVLSRFFLPPPGSLPPLTIHPSPEYVVFWTTVKTITSCVNLALISLMLLTYANMYRELKSRFTLGLIVVMIVLLMYALTSSPLIHNLFGYYAYGLGPFVTIPDLFTTIALVVLIVLSEE